ncbi:MAG: MBL fold metallo-hydrolase [Thermodesulfobacteriota bacterium]|jgi:glyoxylase-like metal-dependent hydrolase (beta-lactamase superfamily II)
MRDKATQGSGTVKQVQEVSGVYQIRVNLPIPGTKVNIYFVEQPTPTLIDAPPEGKVFLDELEAGLRSIGHSINDIRRIIVTHPHFDHCGSARTINKKYGADIWVSQGGARWIEDYASELRREERHRKRLLKDAGAPASEIEYVNEFYRNANRFAHRAKSTRYLSDGDMFELSLFSFIVTEVPGHTPWCIIIHDTKNTIGFTGDFLQRDITSNPLGQWTDIRSKGYKTLTSYIASLKKVRAMRFRTAFPGHGNVIQNPSETIDDLLTIIEDRKKAICRILQKGRLTPFRITCELFPKLSREGLFRGVSDVMAHLEILQDEGLAERNDGNPIYFTAV